MIINGNDTADGDGTTVVITILHTIMFALILVTHSLRVTVSPFSGATTSEVASQLNPSLMWESWASNLASVSLSICQFKVGRRMELFPRA